MIELLLVLWPLFALIVIGYVMRRLDFPGEAFWPTAERINYFVLFPALLFGNLATASLNHSRLFEFALAIVLILAVAWLVLLVLRRLRHWPAARFGPLAQGALRFNTYLGLAAVGSLYGQEGLAFAALLLVLKVPMVNMLSVWALLAERGVSVRRLLLPLLKNPLILTCIVSALVNASGVGLPGGTERLLSLLASASLPLGLLCVGAALRPQELTGEAGALGWNSALRLLGMPFLAYAVAIFLGLPEIERGVLVTFFALPTAAAAYVLTRQLGGDGRLMAGLITLQTLLAMLSLPLVLRLLERFG